MRTLIFSDVHANLEALEAVSEASRDCELRLCLGDVVGYGASPNDATAWVSAHAALTLRGNHDRACTRLEGLEWFNPTAATAARWTQQTLTGTAMEWLVALPAGPLLRDGAVLAHGSPLDEDTYVVDAGDAGLVFEGTAAALQWIGHTHLQGGFVAARGQVARVFGAQQTNPPAAASVVNIELEPGARYLLNPGAVGQPRDADWRAAFAVWDSERRMVEFHRVPYDLAAAQRRILAAGLPASLAQRLAQGR